MIQVRFAERIDLERINEIRKQVNDLHVSGRPDIFRPGFCEEMRDRIYTIFENEDRAVIAALVDSEICGFATVIYEIKPQSPYNNERRIYHIEEFGVDKDHRRCGVATSIVEFLKKDALEKGFERMELDMWSFNESAYAFYQAVGFGTYRRYMELNVCGYPTRENAFRFLREAELLNPGRWGDHSRITAKCAETIARRCGDLDPEKAFVLGLIHDIGRRFGVSQFRHIYDGYIYMTELGYPEAARICLTHSFCIKDINGYIGEYDVTDEQLLVVKNALAECEYNDYDRLIQLCDAIAMPHGAVSLIERMNDVKARYGRYPEEKRRKNAELLRLFEEKAGTDIEALTSGITL